MKKEESDMNKVIEEEKKYLEFTKEVIKKEIEKGIESENDVKKEAIKLSFEDRLRGIHFNLNAVIFNLGERIEKLERAKKCPYFGRFDYQNLNGNKAIPIYVGRSAINQNNKLIVYDWRSPICGLYYDSEIGPVSYISPMGVQTGNLLLKRQITIKDGKLISAVDSNLVTDDELLFPYLNVNADTKMKTIIASIQKEQNAIIRSDDVDIIIQGVAGSGKTSVALHRIAYLIYALDNKIKSKDFLVIGPNDYFLKYISTILPDLETTSVDQKTILDIMNEYLGLNLTLSENTLVKTVDKQKKMKNISIFKGSFEYRDLLDKFVKKCFEGNIIVTDSFKIDGKVVFSSDCIKESLIDMSKQHFNFEGTRTKFKTIFKQNIDDIYSDLNQEYRKMYIALTKDNPLRSKYIEKSLNLRELVYNQGLKLLDKYLKSLNKSCLSLYVSFISELDKAETSLTPEEVRLLQKETLQSIKKKQVQSEDIAGLMYLNYRLTNKKLNYKNVVIDEAQDYNLLTFYSLKNILENARFNIYGDLAQAIYSDTCINSWKELNEKVFQNGCNLLELSKSYRTTIEITNIANNVLQSLNLKPADPVIRHGERVLFADVESDGYTKIDKITEWINSGYKTIAVICKNELETRKVQEELMSKGIEVRHISNSDSQYDGKIFVLTALCAKGLEFDCTIINDASNNVYDAGNEVDMHLLYVATTRALHEQMIMYNKEITEPFKKEIKINNDVKKDRRLIKKKEIQT